MGVVVPLRLKLLKNLSLGVVADYAGIDEAAEIEAFGSELRHFVYEMSAVSIALIVVDKNHKKHSAERSGKWRGWI